ncbi:hypothetical protein [Nocardioides sp. B-3]|uniref:hypothetical protein n=1 Tax=Nocardioides sp. B-3 TaxID=2895565 RepID=UPI0021534C33|nr:hypothetical protein [Nocardioides sp. B-3]UUZ61055.1 hypothetical protein LP418_10555 [Nocardioides sp. B-3]
MTDLLRLPHVGVEVAVDLGRVGQHRHQLEHVAVDLELDARHVVQHVAEPRGERLGVADGEVDGGQVDRRVVLAKFLDMLRAAGLEQAGASHGFILLSGT